MSPLSQPAADAAPVVFGVARLETPLGTLELVSRGEQLCALGFVDGRQTPATSVERRFRVAIGGGSVPGALAGAVARYFAGEVRALEGLPVDPGGSEFQRRVWAALRAIPVAQTATYGEIARRIGLPRAVRAVGSANARNPIALVIPCHRVIGAGGALTGYAYGVERKRWLIEHERQLRLS